MLLGRKSPAFQHKGRQFAPRLCCLWRFADLCGAIVHALAGRGVLARALGGFWVKIGRYFNYENAPVNILIVDDHLLFADALALTLAARLPGCRVQQYSEPQQLLADEAALASADLLIVDAAMPELDGLSLLRILGRSLRGRRVILCSGALDAAMVEKAQCLDIDGFVDKGEPVERFVAAVAAVMDGNGFYSDSYQLLAGAAAPPVVKLSRQQAAILALLQQGQSNKEMARSLAVSLNTVKTHMRLLFDKLDVPNRTACLEKARRLGLV